MITNIQIDPFGFCNSHCWYCPKMSIDNPARGMVHMAPADIDNLLFQIQANTGTLIDPCRVIWTAHYNEIFLHKHLEYLLSALAVRGWSAYLMSNGTTLNDGVIDMIKRNAAGVAGITFNIPSADPDTWSKCTGFPASMHANMISNLRKLIGVVPFMIVVNGWDRNATRVELLNHNMVTSNPHREAKVFEDMFGKMVVAAPVNELVDRSGVMHDLGQLSNQHYIRSYLAKTEVVGCGQGRTTSWLHVNSNMDVFACCNDYNFDTIFGNLRESNLSDIWGSQAQRDVISGMRNGGLCSRCISAVWR